MKSLEGLVLMICMLLAAPQMACGQSADQQRTEVSVRTLLDEGQVGVKVWTSADLQSVVDAINASSATLAEDDWVAVTDIIVGTEQHLTTREILVDVLVQSAPASAVAKLVDALLKGQRLMVDRRDATESTMLMMRLVRAVDVELQDAISKHRGGHYVRLLSAASDDHVTGPACRPARTVCKAR